MNTLGKILIVLIFVMSIFFMAFSFMVFMTHDDWKTKASDAENQLRTARNTNTELQGQIEAIQTQRASENAARKLAITVLEARARGAEQQLATERAELQNLRAAISETGELVAGSLNSLELERQKVETLRGTVKDAESERDRLFKSVIELKNRVLELESVRERLASRENELQGQVTRQSAVMRANGLSEFDDITNVPPPREGLVKSVDGENKYVLLSLGSDEGIRSGHELDVFRRNKYLGRVQVTKTYPDKAVGRVKDSFRKGAIRVGDGVRTK